MKDRSPFEAIEFEWGLTESSVIPLMREDLKTPSFRAWLRRVSGPKCKHRCPMYLTASKLPVTVNCLAEAMVSVRLSVLPLIP